MTEKEFREYLPYIGIQDGAILSKRGDVTFGWRLWLPTAYTVNEAGYDSIINSFLQAYKLLPLYCIVHKQDIFCNELYHARRSEYFLRDAYERHFEGREYLNGRCYLYLTFSSKAVIERKAKESGYFGFGDIKPASPSHVMECADMASQFAAVLSSNSLLVLEQLTTDDLLRLGPLGEDQGVIADYFHLYEDGGPEYNYKFHDDRVVYGDRHLKTWYVQDSDAYPAMVSSVQAVKEMSAGASRVYLSGGSPIGYCLKIPHIVNRYVLTLPHRAVESELDQKRRLMNSFANFSAKDAVSCEELSGYLLASAKENATTIKCFMNLMAWGDESELKDIRNQVVTAFHANLSVSVVEETRIAPLMHYAAIPGAAAECGYDWFLTSEITGFLCHGLWDGYDNGMSKGIIHVCDRKTLTPVTIDIQQVARKHQYINNMNGIVIGPSGSGKSFTMNALVEDFYEAGEHIAIIDVGDSYEGLCQVVREESDGKDGIYNTYDPEHPFGFNPFRGRKQWNDVDSDGENTTSGYEFLLSLLKTIYTPKDGWTAQANSYLMFLVDQFLGYWDNGVPESVVEDLKDAYANDRRERAERNHRKFDETKAHVGWKDATKEIFFQPDKPVDPVFDDFYRYISDIAQVLQKDNNLRMGNIDITADKFDLSDFAGAMDKYKLAGIYGFLLNSKEETDLFESRLTVFEVDKIKGNDDLFPLWLLCIIHSFENKMRSLQCPKVLIIEEAWSAIARPSMAGFITWLWRTARKFNTSAYVVTQDINDLTGSDIIKDAIILNSDVKILLDQRKNVNNFTNSVKLLGLSTMATNLVLSVNTNNNPNYGKYKEAFFAIGENYCNVFAIEMSREQALAFETNKTDKKPVMDWAKRCGSIIQAIKNTVDDEN